MLGLKRSDRFQDTEAMIVRLEAAIRTRDLAVDSNQFVWLRGMVFNKGNEIRFRY